MQLSQMQGVKLKAKNVDNIVI